jgi:hypothetical protein
MVFLLAGISEENIMKDGEHVKNEFKEVYTSAVVSHSSQTNVIVEPCPKCVSSLSRRSHCITHFLHVKGKSQVSFKN